MPKTIEEEKKEEEARKKAEEDLTDKDVSKFTNEQKDDYIDKLKDENARRRIANKKVQEGLDKQKEEQEKAEKELKETKEKLETFEKAEKDKTEKDKTENEKLQARLSELEKSVEKSKQAMEEMTKNLSTKEKRIQVQDREVLAERLVRQMKFEFASDYEREGFMSSLTRTQKDGEFEFNDEEVILKVKDFVKNKKKTPDTPGPGNQNRMSETPITQEIKTLLEKKTLTNEDNKRLDELLEEVDKV